jgi:tetratricopeptide (TPR) repeat protein
LSLGKGAEALQHFQTSFKILSDLVKSNPTFPFYRAHLASAHHNLGVALDASEPKAAAEHYRKAIDLSTKLAAEHPEVPDYRWRLASHYINLGNWLWQRGGDPKGADKHYCQAIELYVVLTKECPAMTRFRDELAVSHLNLAYLVLRSDPPRAVKHLHQAVDVWMVLAKECPAVPKFRSDLADAHFCLAKWLYTDDPEKAEDHYDRSIHFRTGLTKDFPAVLKDRALLASTHFALAMLLSENKEKKSADHFREAIALWTSLAKEHPTNADYLSGLVGAHHALGRLLLKTDEGSAAKHLRQAVDHGKLLFKQSPGRVHQHSMMGMALNELARLLKHPKDWDEAGQLLEEAIVHQQTALKADPSNSTFQARLLYHQESLASVLANQAIAVTAMKELPEDAKRGLWSTYHRLGQFMAATGSAKMVETVPELAAKTAARDPESWYLLNAHGVVLYRAGKLKAAIAKLDGARKLHEQGGNAFDWLYLAMAHHKLGHKDKAGECLEKAEQGITKAAQGKSKDAYTDITPGGRDLPALQKLRDEAEALLAGKTTFPGGKSERQRKRPNAIAAAIPGPLPGSRYGFRGSLNGRNGLNTVSTSPS